VSETQRPIVDILLRTLPAEMLSAIEKAGRKELLLECLRAIAQTGVDDSWGRTRIIRCLIPPILYGNIAIFRSGSKVGFCSWAYATNSAISALENNERPLEIHEWNQGDKLWISDFYCPPNAVRTAARAVRSLLMQRYPTASTARWCRRTHGLTIRKVGKASKLHLDPVRITL